MVLPQDLPFSCVFNTLVYIYMHRLEINSTTTYICFSKKTRFLLTWIQDSRRLETVVPAILNLESEYRKTSVLDIN